ncbi:uncharacterized protein RSE6_03765 [Rhynchosporium secalis]|uniref:Tubby C-terminal domain-containing protein n=1 Tax=Rhynchosporium secalis TaxID=38038 RepID=A0A1E1M3L2_RHYSE|nr:uncharacterized protein RSE6_03765 [Rhynchosporium secalis]
MDASSIFPVSQFGHPKRYEEPVESSDNVVLMGTIFQYLREDSPKSLLPTPVDAKIQTWASSLADYEVSPIVNELLEYTEHSDTSVHSSSSRRGSVFSDFSNSNDSCGPRTPPLTSSMIDTNPRATPPDKLMFSTVPNLPKPAPRVNLNRNCSLRRSSEIIRSPSRATSVSRRMSFRLSSNPSSPAIERAPAAKIPATHQRTQSTVTNLVSLPEVVPSPSKTLENSKPSIPLQLRVSTGSSEAPRLPSLIHPEFELSFPTTEPTFAKGKVQTYVDQARHSAPVSDDAKELLRSLEARKISPNRLSMATPSVFLPSSRFESINRLKSGRQAMQIVIPAQIQQHPLYEVPVYTQTQRLAGVEQEFCRSLETTKLPSNRQYFQPSVHPPIKPSIPEVSVQSLDSMSAAAEQSIARMRRRMEIERIPSTKSVAPRAPTSSLSWFLKGFFSGPEGMHMKMTRRVTSFAKSEWVIESDDGSKIIKGFGHSNSLSRKTGNSTPLLNIIAICSLFTDFSDIDDTPIFTIQKKTGSTRVAEAPNGISLFTIKNPLYASPYWAVNIGNERATNSAAQWTARGDASLEIVTVSCGGFQVGRISLESKAKKHTYILNILPGANYCIMAALATVFDDLRTDEGC